MTVRWKKAIVRGLASTLVAYIGIIGFFWFIFEKTDFFTQKPPDFLQYKMLGIFLLMYLPFIIIICIRLHLTPNPKKQPRIFWGLADENGFLSMNCKNDIPYIYSSIEEAKLFCDEDEKPVPITVHKVRR